MTGTWIYTEATNTAQVTVGTAGTPATFADFVTADRAGVDTVLLSAGSPASALALTYAVRPVEDLALLVKCVVANKTAELDGVFITGKDFRGATQTEIINVTAGNGSYTTTKYWSEITTLDCSDSAVGGGTVWADGDLSVTQNVWGVIWDYGGGQYLIDTNLTFGDTSTSTFFRSCEEQFAFNAGVTPVITNSATFQLGKLVGDWGTAGSFMRVDDTVSLIAAGSATAVFNCYASMIYNNKSTGDFIFANGTLDIRNSVITGSQLSSGMDFCLYSPLAPSIRNTFFTQMGKVKMSVTPTVWSGVHTHNMDQSYYLGGTSVLSNATLSSNSTFKIGTYSSGSPDITLTDANTVLVAADLDIKSATGTIRQKYTVNIYVADKDGANLVGVTVDCEDMNMDAVWAAGTVTTAVDGTITEQTIECKKWYGTSETLTTYSPHKFTLSKAGYETLVLDNVTVDGAIDWHLELQSPKQPPAPWQEGMM